MGTHRCVCVYLGTIEDNVPPLEAQRRSSDPLTSCLQVVQQILVVLNHPCDRSNTCENTATTFFGTKNNPLPKQAWDDSIGGIVKSMKAAVSCFAPPLAVLRPVKVLR
jgi:hypothetical protein